MSWVKGVALTFLFGLLSVATIVAGTILGAFIALMTPFIAVFTGLWVIWFVNQDYDDEDGES
ncbi:MAG: hypothetical protein LC687_06455 [Actinobacteria bacterium]|nr:hypothetical protein [Actinomycetota bacterium]